MSRSRSPSQQSSATRHPPKLLDRVRQALRRKHYSYCTEQAYLHWIKRFILFHNKRHPKNMGAPELEAFLTQPSDLGLESGKRAFLMVAVMRTEQ